MYQQCCASKYFELHAPVQVTFLAKIEHCSQNSDTQTGELTEAQCIRTNQKFHHKFSVFECMKIAQIMLKYPYLCLTLSSTPKCYFFAGRHFFIRKMEIKMADRKKHVQSKVVKNIIFQNKTLLVNVLQP